MPANPMQRLMLFAALAGALPGAQATAQGSPWACSLGYSSYKLRPVNGSDELMNGWALGAEYPFKPSWAVEARFNHQAGTEADVIDLRQQGVMAGLKSTWMIDGYCQGFAHCLVGREQLRASAGPQEDERTSFAYGPGIGLDLAMTPHWSARGTVDFILTHYSGVTQGSPALWLGLVYRH